MIEHFCEMMLFRLRESQSEYIKPCLDSSFKTMEEYKYATGCLKGMQLAEKVLKDLYKDVCDGKPVYFERIRNDISIELHTP